MLLKMRKGVKDGAASLNLCPPAGTVRDSNTGLGRSFSCGGVGTAWQVHITSLPDRKFSDETPSVCFF